MRLKVMLCMPMTLPRRKSGTASCITVIELIRKKDPPTAESMAQPHASAKANCQSAASPVTSANRINDKENRTLPPIMTLPSLGELCTRPTRMVPSTDPTPVAERSSP